MNKKAVCKLFNNSRELADFINSNSLTKDDVISILTKDREFILIYYA